MEHKRGQPQLQTDTGRIVLINAIFSRICKYSTIHLSPFSSFFPGSRSSPGWHHSWLPTSFYIIAYQKTGAAQGKTRPGVLAGFAFVGIALIWVLYPGFSGMLIPVVIYALVLLTMGVLTHKRRGATTKVSFMLVAVGAILFVLSDSLIAVNKFAFEVPAGRLPVRSNEHARSGLIEPANTLRPGLSLSKPFAIAGCVLRGPSLLRKAASKSTSGRNAGHSRALQAVHGRRQHWPPTP